MFLCFVHTYLLDVSSLLLWHAGGGPSQPFGHSSGSLASAF